MPRPSRFLPALLIAGLLAVAPVPALAQWGYVGIGPTFPTGDFGDGANTGYILNLGIGYDINPTLAFGVEGFYGGNGFEGATYDENVKLYGAIPFLQWMPAPDSRLAPHAVGGLGLAIRDLNSDLVDLPTKSAIAWFLGAGVSYDIGPSWGLWGEGRYTSAGFSDGDIDFFGLLAGAYFRFGGSADTP